MNKSIKYLGFSFFGALLLLVLGAAGPIFIPVNNGTGNTTTLNSPKTAGINDLNGTTRIIQIAGGSSGFNDGFGINRVQIDAGGVIKLKATNAAQLFQLTGDGYGEANFPWTFDNGILVGGNTNNSVWLFNPKNGLYRNFLFTDSNGDTQMDPDNDLHINSANNFIDGSLDLLGPVHTTNSSIFYAEIGLGISAPTHKFHIVSTSNDVVGIDSTGVDSASMLHIQNTGAQGPFFDIHSVSQRWGMGVGTNGNYELRRSPVGTDPVNGTTVLSIDTNSVATFNGPFLSSAPTITNILQTNYTASGTWTKTPGLLFIEVTMVGGGGGGGSGTNSTGQAGVGSGGSSGGWSYRRLGTSLLTNLTEVVTVGTNGPGGAFGVGGSAGGASSFGTTNGGAYFYVLGGSGGNTLNGNVGFAAAVAGPIAISLGDLNAGGGGSSVGYAVSTTVSMGGRGGDSMFGGAGIGGSFAGGTGASNGGNALAFGSGGGGGASTSNGGTARAATGGNGAAGVVLITEYYGNP